MSQFPHAQLDRSARQDADSSAMPESVAVRGTLPTLHTTQLGWQFLILAEVADFAVLRRHLGRPRADMLIVDVTERIAALLPEARIVVAGRHLVEIGFESAARLSLDFALNALDTAFDAPFDIDGEQHTLHLSLGVAAAAGHVDDVRLVEEAERALVDARIERVAVVRDVARSTASIDHIALARDLAGAIENEELFLQYQPKVHVRRQEVTSVEALVRWQHPTRGLVLPGDFIPMAEESRDIVALTLWTVRRSIIDQKALADRGHDLRVFINIAGGLLADPGFVRQVCAIVVESDAKLGFEITETSVIRDPESAIANLKVFADIGVTIAIDDYGAGLSSLAYLKQLPARELKIDKLFITQLTSSNRDPLIVRSTIDLAHALDMEVVAEGVETAAAMALLSVMGCDMIQGFLISRPINIDALMRFLESGGHLPAATDLRTPFNRFATVWNRG